MAYYQGDYYQGDPGLFGAIGRTIKGAVGGFIRGGPMGAITGAVGSHIRPAAESVFTRYAARPTPTMKVPVGPAMPMLPSPTYSKPDYRGTKISPTTGLPVKKRRRMNVTNDKALRRAVRRTDGFVKLAKRALRGTGYTVVSKSSRARRVNVREAGAGSVTVH